jgi:putative RecB family exonuclease
MTTELMPELLTRDSLAERNGGVWAYVSASRLNLWLKCPLAFKLRYVDGIKTLATPSLFVGKMAHSALERLYRHRQLGIALDPADLAYCLIESWGQAVEDEGVQFASTDDEHARRKQAIELIVAYCAQLPAEEPRPLAVEAAVETPLVDPVTGENLGIPLVGIMDVVLPDNDGSLIIDFKTTARGGEPLKIMHEIQLSAYSYLFRHTSHEIEGGLEIRSLVKTKVAKVATHRYPARTDRHFRRLFSVIRADLDDLDSGRFVFRPGLGCAMCNFRNKGCWSWDG